MSKRCLPAPTARLAVPAVLRSLPVALLFAMGALFLADAASAVPSGNRPKILVHVQNVVTKRACTTGFAPTTCSEVDTRAPSGSSGAPLLYYAYLVVAKGDSLPDIAGMQCGLDYQGSIYNPHRESDGVGLDIRAFTLCATLQFPYPAGFYRPGDSNLITWDRDTVCQSGALAVAGYWYVASYGQDYLKVIARRVDAKAKVVTCAAEEVELRDSELGLVTFSPAEAEAGCNPWFEDCFYGAPDRPAAPSLELACSQITVRWPVVARATSYVVYRDGGGSWTTTVNSYVDTSPGRYGRSYNIQAKNVFGQSQWSPEGTGRAPSSPLPTGLSPVNGPAGTPVIISGSCFGAYDAATCRVFFTGASGENIRATLTGTGWTDWQIKCLVPPGATAGPVTVVNKCGQLQVGGGWTPVRILDLAAGETGGTVEITWSVPEDAGPVAFQIGRSTGSSGTVRLTQRPLTGPAPFRYVDATLPNPGTYEYYLWEVDRQGRESLAARVEVEYRGGGDVAQILAVRPNPASAGVEVTFQVTTPGRLRLEAFDVQGRRVRVIDDRFQESGAHQAAWDCQDDGGLQCPAGMYVIRLTGPGILSSRKVLVCK